jgi:hypothetical protein
MPEVDCTLQPAGHAKPAAFSTGEIGKIIASVAIEPAPGIGESPQLDRRDARLLVSTCGAAGRWLFARMGFVEFYLLLFSI